VSGGDITGWVESVGDGVDASLVGTPVLVDPAVGDGAIGETLPGGLAELVLGPAENLIPLPDEDRLVAFAALPIAYGTAYRMIATRAKVQAGETVVVHGASGGVGVACVQFSKRLGARVIALTSSEEKAERLRALGADETVNTLEQDFSGAVWKLTGKTGADVVVDYTGKETWPGSIRCTRHGGRIVTCGATTGFDATTDLRYVWRRELDILGSDGWTRQELLDVVGLVAGREIDPVVHGVYPLSQAREAVAQLEERKAFGKVIVVPDAVYGQVNDKEGSE
jgi:alcohol dehydrogenase